MKFENTMMYGEWNEFVLRPNKLWIIPGPLLWIRPTGEHVELSPFLITDYATIPKLVQPLFPKRNDVYDLAAAFHDDLIIKYHNKGYYNRGKSHRVFNEIAKYYHTPDWQRRIMYRVVQSYGAIRYLRYRIFPETRNYEQYFGWNLTPDEIYRYHQLRRVYSQIRRDARVNISKMNKLIRKTFDYEEALHFAKTRNIS